MNSKVDLNKQLYLNFWLQSVKGREYWPNLLLTEWLKLQMYWEFQKVESVLEMCKCVILTMLPGEFWEISSENTDLYTQDC